MSSFEAPDNNRPGGSRHTAAGEDAFSDDSEDVPLPQFVTGEEGEDRGEELGETEQEREREGDTVLVPEPSTGEASSDWPDAPASFVVASSLLQRQREIQEQAASPQQQQQQPQQTQEQQQQEHDQHSSTALAASPSPPSATTDGGGVSKLSERLIAQSSDVVLSRGSPAAAGAAVESPLLGRSAPGGAGGGPPSLASSGTTVPINASVGSEDADKGVWVRFRHEDHDALQRMQRDLVSERAQRQELESRLRRAEADVTRWRERTERAMAIVKLARSDADLPTMTRTLELGEALAAARRENADLVARASRSQKSVDEARRASAAAEQLVSDTMNEKLQQDVEMEVWRRKISALQGQIEDQRRAIEAGEGEVKRLAGELQAKNDQNYKMGVKLLELNSKVCNVELQLRKIAVRKINRLMPNSPAELTITKNPANKALGMDVCEKGVKHSGHTLKSVQMSQGSTTRFTITYGDGSYDTFEHDQMAADIVRDIKEMLDENQD
jgi:hypothetical protein